MSVLGKRRVHQRCKSLAVLISLISFGRNVAAFLPFLFYPHVNKQGISLRYSIIINHSHQCSSTEFKSTMLIYLHSRPQSSSRDLIQRTENFFTFFPPQIGFVLNTTSAHQLYLSFGPLIKRTGKISFKDLIPISKYL